MDTTDYPYPKILPLDRLEAAADELRLCRQERRVTLGRLLSYPLREIAERLNLAQSTVRNYDRSARQRAGCEECGDLGRLVLSLMFPK